MNVCAWVVKKVAAYYLWQAYRMFHLWYPIWPGVLPNNLQHNNSLMLNNVWIFWAWILVWLLASVMVSVILFHHILWRFQLSDLLIGMECCTAQYIHIRPVFCLTWIFVINAETSVLWERHCKRLQVEDLVQPVSPSSYPSYDKWDMGEGPPPTSWKSLYVTLRLQQLADRQNGG